MTPASVQWPLPAKVRMRWDSLWHCRSETRFAVGLALIWSVLYSRQFWTQSIEAMWHPSLGSLGFMISLLLLVVFLQAIPLLLMPTRALMRAAASVFFVVAAASSHFVGAYGVVMNRDMLRNVVETDKAEVLGLLNFGLIASVLLLGVLPAVLVWRVSLPEIGWMKRVRQRTGFIVVAAVACLLGLFAYSANYAVFFRQHKPIRYLVMPAAPVSSLIGALGVEHRDVGAPLINASGAAQRGTVAHARPVVLILVVGETARAANFQLGGYSRATNPELSKVEGLVYFRRVSSCGTSTADSLPCMFSHLGREQFVVGEASRYTNLLDTLAQGGFDVEWRDNNAGCKGVCARVHTVTYAGHSDTTLCPNSYCYDDVMLSDLPARLANVRQDTLIVLHQIGSHGPAYVERYPPQRETFSPACRTSQLQHCSAEEIRNVYDNTIAYTDHVLARIITALRVADGSVDSMLIYASDHGESLGEQGMYLHGMPYRFAPKWQKEVPMLLWASQGFEARTGLRRECVRAHADAPLSHDNLYHTILGAAGVRNSVYARELDLLAGCRTAPDGFDHE